MKRAKRRGEKPLPVSVAVCFEGTFYSTVVCKVNGRWDYFRLPDWQAVLSGVVPCTACNADEHGLSDEKSWALNASAIGYLPAMRNALSPVYVPDVSGGYAVKCQARRQAPRNEMISGTLMAN